VEAGVSQGWEKWVGDRGMVLAQESYGASSPGNVNFEKFGFTVTKVIDVAQRLR
jgi:transketolase